MIRDNVKAVRMGGFYALSHSLFLPVVGADIIRPSAFPLGEGGPPKRWMRDLTLPTPFFCGICAKSTKIR